MLTTTPVPDRLAEDLRKPRITVRYTDGHGQEHKVEFVTTSEFVNHWWWIGEGMKSLYLYGINPPPDLAIEEGKDGAERGDFKIITNKHIPADFICGL